jgi:hypothetical protein
MNGHFGTGMQYRVRIRARQSWTPLAGPGSRSSGMPSSDPITLRNEPWAPGPWSMRKSPPIDAVSRWDCVVIDGAQERMFCSFLATE